MDSRVIMSPKTFNKPVPADEAAKIMKAFKKRFKHKLQDRPLLGELLRSPTRTYVLSNMLGAGSFGQVYKAYDTKSGDIVAIKKINMDRSNSDEVNKIYSEVASLMLVRHKNNNNCHPSIVCILDVTYTRDAAYIVLEYIEGAYIKSLPRHLAIRIIRRIAEGLMSLHEMNMIHRDIKPDNIIITPDNQIKLVDLGIACLLEDNTETKRIHMCEDRSNGTYIFSDPTSLRRPQNYTNRSDIYSLGVTLVCLILGNEEFRQDYPYYHSTPEYKYEDEYMKFKAKFAVTGVERGYPKSMIDLIIQMCDPLYSFNRPAAGDIIEEMNKLEASGEMEDMILTRQQPDYAARAEYNNKLIDRFGGYIGNTVVNSGGYQDNPAK